MDKDEKVATINDLNIFVENLTIFKEHWFRYEKELNSTMATEFYYKIADTDFKRTLLFKKLYKDLYAPIEKFFKYDYPQIPQQIEETFNKKLLYYLSVKDYTDLKTIDFTKRFSDPLEFFISNSKNIMSELVSPDNPNATLDVVNEAKLKALAISYSEVLLDIFVKLASFNTKSLLVEGIVHENRFKIAESIDIWYNYFKRVMIGDLYLTP